MSERGDNLGRTQLRVAIIGAGFSGLAMAIRLRQAGIDDFTVFEAADDVGGTWRDNTYPGCACDVPSHLYSLSFDRKPDWSRKYGEQPEILEYLRSCVSRFDLAEHIRFATQVVWAGFDEEAGIWRLRMRDGATDWAHVVVSGTGPLSRPSVPEIVGADRFEGAQFHSADWDHDFDLEGKRVAVVGTGASAIQFVPAIAPRVERLYLFQRTPPWVVPKPDRPFTRIEKRLFQRVPALDWLYRQSIYWTRELQAIGFVRHPRILRIVEWIGRRHIARNIDDPEVRAKVTPSYRAGCKRILPSNDYYPALNRENVEVITTGIDRIERDRIVDREGVEREVDAVIYGTGFRVADFLAPMEVVGKGGRSINEAWRDGAEAYFGITVSGFPNFYMLVGPNTGLGHNSIVFMAEAQVHYVMQCIDTMARKNLRWLDVLPTRQREFNDDLQRRMARTVWTTGCKSWYLDEQGKNFTLWPGFTWEYWLRTRRLNEADYDLAR